MKLKIGSIIFLVSFFSFSYTFAYEAPAHQAITKKIVEVYNKYYEPKITPEQASWIIDGSGKEDVPPRWINHFYDPVTQEGWTGENEGDVPKETVQFLANIGLSPVDALNSIEWLRDINFQRKYAGYEGDQTYDRALRTYAFATAGSAVINQPGATLQDAFTALGHNLHLLEDLSVPAHVRNDTHAPIEGTNDPGDPYEQWTANLNNLDFSIIDKLNSASGGFSCAQIEECFRNLAKYTNDNFYSIDTFEDQKYRILEGEKIKSDERLDFYSRKDSFGEIYIFKIIDTRTQKPIVKGDLINQSYWQLLSKQTVLAGVETIKIFFRNAEEKRISLESGQNPFAVSETVSTILSGPFVSVYGEYVKAKSFFGQITDSAFSAFSGAWSTVSSFFANVINSGDSMQLAGEVDLSGDENQNSSGDEMSALRSQVVALQKELATFKNQKTSSKTSTKKTASVKKSAEAAVLADEIVPENEEQVIEDENVPLAPKICSYSSNQAPSRLKAVINEVAWMGTSQNASDEWIEIKNISGAPADLAGWQLIDAKEDIKIVFGEEDSRKITNKNIPAGGFYLLERTDDNSVSGEAADFVYTGTLSNSDESLKLFDNNCNLVDEVLAGSNWPAGDNSEKRTMERGADLSWHTSSVIGGTAKRENSTAYSGGSGSGSGSSSSNNSSLTNSNNSSQQNDAEQQVQPKILITEIKLQPTGERFIELYNPSGAAVDLTNWYLQRKTQTGSSFSSLVSKTYFENKSIGPGGHFLVLRSEAENADIVYASLTLTDSNTIQLKNANGEVADKVGWGSAGDCEGSCAENPSEGQTIQRKFLDGSYLDTDNNSADFEIQNCPNPKNQAAPCQQTLGASTSSLNFNVAYNPQSVSLSLNWQSAGGDSFYKIKDISSSTEILPAAETTSTQAEIYISEVGRNYKFLLEAREGQATGTLLASAEAEVSVPSFIKDFYFFKSDYKGESDINLISFSYDNYPFLPDVVLEEPNTVPNYKALVFYLNSAPVNKYLNDGQPHGVDLTGALTENYGTCAGTQGFSPALLLPDAAEKCNANLGGFANSAMRYGDYLVGNNNRLLLPVSASDFSPSDYLTIGFYGFRRNFAPYTDPSGLEEGVYSNFRLIAVDKTRYGFQLEKPPFAAPQIAGDLVLNFSRQGSKIDLSWEKATDADTADPLINYEIQYNLEGEWQDLGVNNFVSKLVLPGDVLNISVRARDELGNYSNILTTNWFYPKTTINYESSAGNFWNEQMFGEKNCPSCELTYISESLAPAENFQFNVAIVRLKHDLAAHSSNLRLRVFGDDGQNKPDPNNILGESSLNGLFKPNESEDLTFYFDNPVSVSEGNKYWLVLDVSSYSDSGGGYQNRWRNWIDNGTFKWYLKLGLTQ